MLWPRQQVPRFSALPLSSVKPLCHAAAQQKGESQMAHSPEGSATADPPLVYPSPDSADLWIVERPLREQAEPSLMTFSGPNALNMALRYAYEEFGSARFFPFPSQH